MSDKELEEYIRKVEPNFDYNPHTQTIEMSNEYYNLMEERMTRLINKNEQLQQENKQLKENFKKQSYCRYGNTCDDSWDCTDEEYHTMCERNAKLSILPNALESWLEERVKEDADYKTTTQKTRYCVYEHCLDKLKELMRYEK